MSSQASLSDQTIAVRSFLTYLCRFGGPVLIFIGTIGCILNLIIFTQKTLRKSPCSAYFIAYNIINLLYICSILLFLTVSLGYNIDPSIYNLIFCRLRLYAALLFHGLSQFYLVLASIDRMLITSRNALTRRRSTHRLAYVCIVTGTIFWALFHSHALIFPNIIQLTPNYFVCLFQQSVEYVFVNYYAIVKETVVLSLMILSGLWSINNVRSMRRVRAVPTEFTRTTVGEGSPRSTSAKDRQLLFMLIMDIAIYAVFSFILAIYYIYLQITQNYVKSSDRIQLESYIRNICLFSITIPCCINCYANLLVSKTFRSEVKKVVLWR